MHDERSSGLKQFHIFFFIETESSTEFFVDKGIIAFHRFSFLDGLSKPLDKLEMFGILCAIESEFKLLFGLPEILGLESFDFSHLWSEMLLIFVVKIGGIFFVMSGVSVLIEDEFAEVVVFKDILPVRAEPVIQRNEALSDCMDEPLG